MDYIERIENIMETLVTLRDEHYCGDDDEVCFCNDFDLALDRLKELRNKLIDEEITHLESLLPMIEDRHEYDGTIEVIERLGAKKEL